MKIEKTININAILEYETGQLSFRKRVGLAFGLLFCRNIRLRVRQFTFTGEAAEAEAKEATNVE